MTAYEIAAREKAKSFIKKNFTADKALSGNYLLYRFLRPLLKLNYKLFKQLRSVTPWTTQASIRTFDQILKSHMVGFEYGSGFSTLYFAKRLKHITSIEHNPEWYKIVSDRFKSMSIGNVDYHLVPMQKNLPNEAYPFYQEFNLSPADFQIRTEYTDYFTAILKFPDAHFDFIIVDGRARVECCLLAISKLKPGGIFVLDNSDRARYIPVFKVLREWKSVTTTTGLFDTTIWFKP